MSNGDNLVPASIVQLIFNQVKQSTDSNTDSIKALTIAINELVKILLEVPSRKELMEKMDVIENRGIDRANRLLEAIYAIRDGDDTKRKEAIAVVEEYIDETKTLVTDGNTTCANAHVTIGTALNEFTYHMKIFITVIAITLSLIGIYNYYVDKNLDIAVEKRINKAVEMIITSRPGNILPYIKDNTMSAEDFKALDKNKDGVITMDEATGKK